jgi:hypothetical protein
MLAECRMDHTAVEQYLGCIRYAVKGLQCLVELVAIVAGEGCHPGFDFLTPPSAINSEGRRIGAQEEGTYLLQRHDECSSLVTRQYGVVKPQ